MNENAKEKLQNFYQKVLVFSYQKLAKPTSLYFREVFESRLVKPALGFTVLAVTVLAGILPDYLSSFQIWLSTNPTNSALTKLELTTEQSLQKPLEIFHLTKQFGFFHPGLDFATDAGSAVLPILPGKVEKVSRLRFGYGNHVVINHGSGLKSLYAHFSKITVKVGQEIDKNTILGFIGSTGWSTGPHLHLEIVDNGDKVNPRLLFEEYFGDKLASVQK